MINEIINEINPINESLRNHSLYEKINTKQDLCFFMERHVFAVLDFMSLLNALKRNLLPSDILWTPRKNNDVARFINEITVAEESDENIDGTYISHFELYLEAMKEVGASTSLINEFVQEAKVRGVSQALKTLDVPLSSSHFISNTFNLIEENAIHKIAASFCFGREKSIPIMFQSILDKIGIKENDAPKFHYYIKRHIEIDGEEHGPMSENLLSTICKDNTTSWTEALETAISALKARDHFWSEIESEMS
jgi:hypothetical protein